MGEDCIRRGEGLLLRGKQGDFGFNLQKVRGSHGSRRNKNSGRKDRNKKKREKGLHFVCESENKKEGRTEKTTNIEEKLPQGDVVSELLPWWYWGGGSRKI